MISNELPEDDPKQGVEDFQTLIGDRENCVLIGVSCGLSADYVAGAIEFAMDNNHAAIVLGFNNVTAFRTDLFGRVLKRIATADNDKQQLWHTLTPIIGPEAVAGSSRMKGGSTTLIILDVSF